MTINHQPKAAMNAANGLDAAGPATAPGADTEVVAQARRRHFSNADKRRILAAADRCTKPGEIGALMRREGVYSSSLSTWRRQRDAVELAALEPQRSSCGAGLERGDMAKHVIRPPFGDELLRRLRSKCRVAMREQRPVEISVQAGSCLDTPGPTRKVLDPT
jgi:transposase-like protein